MKFLLLFSITAASASAAEIDPSWLKCKEKSECASTGAFTCGCAGATAKALNGKFLQEYADRKQNENKGLRCAAVLSDHWTCTRAEILCENGKCTLKEKPIVEKKK